MLARDGAPFGHGPTTKAVYLHPGQLFATAEPHAVTTILGSCVAVCLWDAQLGVGGMNHFLLPHFAGSRSTSARFGSVALELLLQKLVGLGARQAALRAKVFGGACVLEALRGSHPLGDANVDVARRFLRRVEVPIVAEDVGGDQGRKLVFQTDDGSVVVRMLRGSHGSD
jgi:chemotaxis protein CheD